MQKYLKRRPSQQKIGRRLGEPFVYYKADQLDFLYCQLTYITGLWQAVMLKPISFSITANHFQSTKAFSASSSDKTAAAAAF